MSVEIPNGLTDLLQDFTVAVLKERPPNLVKFAAEYFNKLNESKNEEEENKNRGVRFAQSEPMQTDESDDEPMPEPPPSRFLRRKSVSAERFDPEAEDDDGDQQGSSKRESRLHEIQKILEDPCLTIKEIHSVRWLSYFNALTTVFRTLDSLFTYLEELHHSGKDAKATGLKKKIVYPKSDEQRKRLTEAVKPIFIFRSLEPEQMHCILDAMFEKKVSPGEHVIDQGADGDNFYVIDSGTYDIYVEGKLVGNYEHTGSFGELALMYNMPRAATIIATSEGTLWAMDRQTFRRIVLKNAFMKRKVYETLLENVPMLKTLNPYERMNVADALYSKAVDDGEVIIRQGDSAECMYFIEDGEVRIAVKNKNDPSAGEMEVKKCTKGMYFGELALVTQKPRAATVYAVGRTKLAVLDVGAFERLLGPCMDIMKRNIDEYEEQLVSVFGSKAAISDLR